MDLQRSATPAEDSIRLVQDLSVLVITSPGKWKDAQFHPSKLSVRKVEWFEGTGTVIGIRRNRVFVLSSIHCVPNSSYSFFVKGSITDHQQVVATLSANKFEAGNNGIDIALFSCNVSSFDATVLRRMSESLMWQFSPPSLCARPIMLSLVHFPTLEGDDDITRRLHEPVFPVVSSGVLLAVDEEGGCFDSSILATAGSSGGLIIGEEGFVLGSHDSQHDETPDGSVASTHRMCGAVRGALSCLRGASELFHSAPL